MTMLDDSLEGGADVAAKIASVKLDGGDWRKLALLLVAIILSGVVGTYQLVAYIARSEVQRLDTKDSEFTERVAAMDVRVKHLEDVQADVAVLRNDVGWIRREMERQNKK